MRLAKPLKLEQISQVLAKGACPVCAFVKNDQAALLRGGMEPEQITALCNFHAWALAAAVDRDIAARVFLNVLKQQPSKPAAARARECSFCCELVQQEVVHIRELIAQLDRGKVLDWMKRQGTFCQVHGNHIRQLAPLKLHPLIDEIMERSRAAVMTDMENLLRRTEEGKGTGGGTLGRVAEFLTSQRGISR